MEKITGKKFGDKQNPLLVSVRSGARASMPGMMDTILNLGLNEEVVEIIAAKTGNERWARDCYRRFIQMYADVVMEVGKKYFEELIDRMKAARGVTQDVELTAADLKELAEQFKAEYKEKIGADFPEGTPMIFGPDRNLGNYINSITGRNMLLWDGACHVHEQFSLEKILSLKKQYPNAEVITHPECKQPVIQVSDFVGSTAALLKHTIKSDAKQFIVATESGVIHEMRKRSPDKEFIPAPPNDSTCACNECNFMRLNTMEKLYNCLKFEMPEIFVDEEVQKKAIKPIKKMLEISEKLGL